MVEFSVRLELLWSDSPKIISPREILWFNELLLSNWFYFFDFRDFEFLANQGSFVENLKNQISFDFDCTQSGAC